MRYTPFFLGLIATTTLFAHDDWSLNNHFALFGDFVYLRRTGLQKHTIIKDSSRERICTNCTTTTDTDSETGQKETCESCTTQSIFETEDLVHNFGFEPGARIGAAYMLSKRSTIELSYLYVHQWHDQQVKERERGTIYFPFDEIGYGKDYFNATKAQAKYLSRIYSVELNYWRHNAPRRANYFSASGIVGLRYINLREHFNLAFTKGANTSDYRIEALDHLRGLQIGGNLQMNPLRTFSLEATVKVGGLVNRAEQKTFLGDENNTKTLRDFHEQHSKITLLCEALALFSIQCSNHFNMHAGYQFLYLSGVALAPEQVSKKTKENSGEELNIDGSIILHGLFAGISLGF